MANKVVGIIGAMDSEVTYLKEHVEGASARKVAGNEYVWGTLAGTSVVVARCGIGKVNAAVCAQVMIDLFGATHLINTGVAGSLDATIDIGDIVVATDAVEHDLDITPLGYAPGEHPGLGVSFEADAGLRAAALAACAEVAPEVHAFEGRICSGDQFIGSNAAKARIIDAFGGKCCEMEGAAIAHVCQLSGIPFVVVRAISDKADDSVTVSYAEFEKAAAAHCAKIVLAMLGHLA